MLDRWGDHPGIDWVLAAMVAGAHALVMRRGLPAWTDDPAAEAVLIGAAAVVATIGSLASIGYAVYGASGAWRMTRLKEVSGRAMRANWQAMIIATAAAAFVLLACPLLPAGWSDPLATGALVLWGLSFGRLVWLLGGTQALQDLDGGDPRPRPAPQAKLRRP